ncbi:MAG: NAD-dependent epimerase/dehydratase family protein [Rhodothermales bacterium]
MKLLVTGGNGFIGQEVCRIAVGDGHKVISVARSGRPEISAPWTDEVEWVAANVLEPETWRDHLAGCDAVIHCVGIISEKPEQGVTFERLNGDAGDVASWEAEHAGVGRFVLISAAANPPGVSSRYLSSKRQAESAVRGRSFESSILRPAIVYGPGRPASVLLGKLLQGVGRLPVVGNAVRENRPLHVDQVALAAVRAATEEGYGGTIGIDNIEYLAGAQWRLYADAEAAPKLPARPLVVGGVVAGFLGGALWALRERR